MNVEQTGHPQIYRKRKYNTAATNSTSPANGAYFFSRVCLTHNHLSYHIVQLLRSPLELLRVVEHLQTRVGHVYVTGYGKPNGPASPRAGRPRRCSSA